MKTTTSACQHPGCCSNFHRRAVHYYQIYLHDKSKFDQISDVWVSHQIKVRSGRVTFGSGHMSSQSSAVVLSARICTRCTRTDWNSAM